MESASTFKITCTWLTGGASELPVLFLSPDGSDIESFDPVPLTLEPESDASSPCEIEIVFNRETQFELHRFEVISANKNLEVYRDEDCGGYLATLKGSPVQVDSQQAFKFSWDAKAPEMVRALRFKFISLLDKSQILLKVIKLIGMEKSLPHTTKTPALNNMQSQLLAQLLFSKMGMKANLPSVPPTPIILPTDNTTINNTTNNNIDKEHIEGNNSNNITTSHRKEVKQGKSVHEPQDEISRLIELQEQKFVQLLSDVEKRMDEKLAKLQLLVEDRFNEIERRLSTITVNINNSSNIDTPTNDASSLNLEGMQKE